MFETIIIKMTDIEIGDILPLFGYFSPEMKVTFISDTTIFCGNLISFEITDDEIPVSRETSCEHLSSKEIGSVGYFEDSIDCGYGCKIMKCEKCEETFESHRSIYGCKIGRDVSRETD